MLSARQYKRQFISFPAELHETMRRFYDIAGFSCVARAIDCTHVRIVCPNRNNKVDFMNKKQFYWNSKATITNIIAPWPRATHDSRIFDKSTFTDQFRNGSTSGLLADDSWYAFRSYLMIPLLNPRNDAEVRYNEAQRRTRAVTERCFGIMKRHFPCFGCELLEPLWLSL